VGFFPTLIPSVTVLEYLKTLYPTGIHLFTLELKITSIRILRLRVSLCDGQRHQQ
jgi:hypothetical protein